MVDLSLLVFLGLCFLTATSGGVFRPGVDYEDLRHPSWRPPNYLFGPVWGILYIMIAVSGWLIWWEIGNHGGVSLALGIYVIQLVLNFLWSAIFFGLKRRGLALLEMALLWISIVSLIVLFHPINALAAWLLVPYLLWVTFAFALNYALWSLNRAHSTHNIAGN